MGRHPKRAAVTRKQSIVRKVQRVLSVCSMPRLARELARHCHHGERAPTVRIDPFGKRAVEAAPATNMRQHDARRFIFKVLAPCRRHFMFHGMAARRVAAVR